MDISTTPLSEILDESWGCGCSMGCGWASSSLSFARRFTERSVALSGLVFTAFDLAGDGDRIIAIESEGIRDVAGLDIIDGHGCDTKATLPSLDATVAPEGMLVTSTLPLTNFHEAFWAGVSCETETVSLWV